MSVAAGSNTGERMSYDGRGVIELSPNPRGLLPSQSSTSSPPLAQQTAGDRHDSTDIVLAEDDPTFLQLQRLEPDSRLAFHVDDDSMGHRIHHSDKELLLVVDNDSIGFKDGYGGLSQSSSLNGSSLNGTEPTHTVDQPIAGMDSELGNWAPANLPYHCHTPRSRRSNKHARNQLIVVSVLCALFMVAEIIGGVLSNSLALISDATHMASDFSGFLVSIFAIWVANRPPTTKMSFGYHRAEVVGATVSVLIIWLTTGVLVYLAIERILHHDYEIHADEMLVTAGLGVAFNIIMGVVLNCGLSCCKVELEHSSFGHSHSGLHGHSHGGPGSQGHAHSGHGSQGHSHGGHGNQGHSHGHGHIHGGHGHGHTHGGHGHASGGYNHSVGGHTNINGTSLNTYNYDTNVKIVTQPLTVAVKQPTNINVRAAFIHVIGDLIQSVGVLIAAYIIKYKPEYKMADPICTFLFSALVLFTTVTILRDTCRVFLEGVPNDIDYGAVKEDLERIDFVRAVHSLNIWALTVDKNCVTAHIAVDFGAEFDTTVKKATEMLQSKYQVFQSTVQVEYYDNELMSSCEQCVTPKLKIV